MANALFVQGAKIASDEVTGTTLSGSATIGSGKNRIVLVGYNVKNVTAGTNATVSGITFNGVAMTALINVLKVGATRSSTIGIYGILEANLPAAGTYTVVMTSADSNRRIIGYMEFSDCIQTITPTASTTGTLVNTLSTTITPAHYNSIIADMFGSGGGVCPNPTIISGGTQAWEDLNTVGTMSSCMGYRSVATPASTSFGYDLDINTQERLCLAGVVLRPFSYLCDGYWRE